MDFEQIISTLINNGAAIGCLIYFMVYNNKQLENMRDTIESLKDLIKELEITLKGLKNG